MTSVMYKAQLVKVLLGHIRECMVKYEVDLHDGIYKNIEMDFDDIPEAANGHVFVDNKQQLISTLLGKISKCLLDYRVKLRVMQKRHIFERLEVAFEAAIPDSAKKVTQGSELPSIQVGSANILLYSSELPREQGSELPREQSSELPREQGSELP